MGGVYAYRIWINLQSNMLNTLKVVAVYVFQLSNNMQVSSVKLKEGDIVVMGSDGLFDNVFDQEIASTVVSNSDVTEAGK